MSRSTLALLLLSFLIAGPAQAVDPVAKCQSKKLTAAAKYALCRLKAEAKSAKTGEPADFEKCELKLDKLFAKAEKNDTCPTEQDQDGVRRALQLGTEAVVGTFLVAECGSSQPQCGGLCPIGQTCTRLNTCGGQPGQPPCINRFACAEPFPDCTLAECLCVPAHKRAFVTSFYVNGDFGGVSSADALCQLAAIGGGLPGSYLAWVTDGNPATSPASRFNRSTIPYARTDGFVIANDWADLTDGMLQDPLGADEKGVERGGPVYTNTEIDGTQLDPDSHCNNWTDKNEVFTSKGNARVRDAGWTRPAGQALPQILPGCGGDQPLGVPTFNGAGLYCFQQ